MLQDILKEANVSIHVIATGAGAGLQKQLWEVPGSSAYLSGAAFPYAAEEQEELLGFMPEHFSSEEAAIDLASAAYMKAFRFGGKKPVGLGIAASVASEKEHRGDHRIHACMITDDRVISVETTLDKGTGYDRRYIDGLFADDLGLSLLRELDPHNYVGNPILKDNTELAQQRFFLRPFFQAGGKRLPTFDPFRKYALMPGAYNPPHEGHFGTADNMEDHWGYQTIFEITAEPPHKDALSVQNMLKRAKLLQGHHRLFTRKNPYYIDKARSYPGVPLVLGADAMLRMLDPKWGLDLDKMFAEFKSLGTCLYVANRYIDGRLTTLGEVASSLPLITRSVFDQISFYIPGEWNISSTELRNKML
jgi:nicotinic acid mononucleotide adenylyltransferase